MPTVTSRKNLTPATIRAYVREDCKDYTPEEIAFSIGAFASDPASNAFQRQYLIELWTLLREKKGWKE